MLKKYILLAAFLIGAIIG